MQSVVNLPASKQCGFAYNIMEQKAQNADSETKKEL